MKDGNKHTHTHSHESLWHRIAIEQQFLYSYTSYPLYQIMNYVVLKLSLETTAFGHNFKLDWLAKFWLGEISGKSVSVKILISLSLIFDLIIEVVKKPSSRTYS